MKYFFLSIANLFSSGNGKPIGDDSTTVPAATTREAVRNKHLHKSGRKEDVRKDVTSAIKTFTDQAIRQTSRHEPLFSGKTKKLHKKRPKEDVRKDNPSTIKTFTDQPIRQTTWHEPLLTGKTKKLFKKRPKEDVRKDNPSTIKTFTDQPIRQTSRHEPLLTGKTKKLLKTTPKEDVRKDNPSTIKSVTHKPIRQIPWYDQLFSKPVENKTLPRTIDEGRSFASQKNRDDSTTVPAATTREAVRNKHLLKSGRKEDVRKDGPSTIKSVTDQRIRQTSWYERLFSKPVENKTLPETVAKGRSFLSFKRDDSTTVPAATTREAVKNKYLSKSGRKEDVRKDGPSTIKSVTHKPIRQKSWYERLFSKPVENKTLPETVDKGRRFISFKSHVFTRSPPSDSSSDLDCEESLGVFVSVNRDDSINTSATAKLCAGQNTVKDNGVQEFTYLSIIRNEEGEYLKKAEQSTSQQTNRNHVFARSPPSDSSSDLDCEESLGGDSTNTPATAKLFAGQNTVKDNGVQKFKYLSIIRNEVGEYLKKAEKSTSVQTNRKSHVFPRSPSSDSINDLDCEENLGFPNPSQICYMNSILQSLLTLTEFIRDIRIQKYMWELAPGAEFLSAFMDIVRCHRSPNKGNKLQALFAFKREVGKRCAEFMNMGQKDAHEFLTTFLDYIERLHPVITGRPGMAYSYICPIQKHLMFKMTNTRACKKCGQISLKEEVFNNLSLNLVPQESVKEMLDNYLLKTEFECKCVCGGANSTQCYSFDTLPRILILHVKRFLFTPFYTLKKLIDPINISRELIISSTQGQSWYSLVSIVSHLGSNGNLGHYVSAGVKRDAAQDDPTDQWVFYDDNYVKRTTGQSICNHLKTDAYILFYKRRE
ncbi:uncharacterized protein [Paralichthys olivaceus]|uniref:uncharacterized protein isoform X2 n=1 Tax=Paralichthys olivaceus TaxID=8255 RepID=UPI0037501F5B